MTTDPNDDAYPTSVQDDGVWGGLTKREYFAIHLMAALAVNSVSAWEHDAKASVVAADALIAALNEVTP